MKFFWPAPLDLIDPSYDFILEKGNYRSDKHRNQKYPHEIFDKPVYDGFVISKIYVDQGKSCRWNTSQVNRFLREGAKRFLRFPKNTSMLVMGDSGSFTRSTNEQLSSHLIDESIEVLDYYNTIGVDYGLAPDNVIGGYWKEGSKKRGEFPKEWEKRWVRTIDLAETFWKLCKKRDVLWQPIGVAQGWNINTYQKAVIALQEIGFEYIALGGLNRLNSNDILTILNACAKVKNSKTNFHLLGVSRGEHLEAFKKYGIGSFDSAMPIRQAINDDTNCYHSQNGNYIAIRIPQTLNSPRLKQLIKLGTLNCKETQHIESLSMQVLREYDQENISINAVLEVLKKGIEYRMEQNFIEKYKKLLIDKPWKVCSCQICQKLGIEIIILRNRERNLRRGFHNLFQFSELLKQNSEIHNI